MVTNKSTRFDERNETNSMYKDPLISIAIPAVMFTTGIIGNVLAIVVLARSSRERKQTVIYRLVGALACTDLCSTCATTPLILATYVNDLKWVGGKALCTYQAFMFIFASFATILIIGLMAIDRYIAMRCPFIYNTYITPDRANFGVIVTWISAVFMGCLPIMGFGEAVKQFPGTWCFFNFTSSNLKYQIFVYVYASILLLAIAMTAVSNIVVTFLLRKMRRKAMSSMNSCLTKRNSGELQMMVLLLGITIIFSACWCPFIVRVLINQVRQSQENVTADLHTLRIASFNQILDPWIYILFRKELWVKIGKIYKANIFNGKCCCKTGNEIENCNRRNKRNSICEPNQMPLIQSDSDNSNISDGVVNLDKGLTQA